MHNFILPKLVKMLLFAVLSQAANYLNYKECFSLRVLQKYYINEKCNLNLSIFIKIEIFT